ncbi:MAG: 1,4-alpha-glucan branching enzyme, partial [Sphingomonas sp.]|nr:1,4-alpha-glucan branching enzyme [Sphingomonas sp.]
MRPPAQAIAALLDGSHADPFSLLGPHDGPEGTFARAILPGAHEVEGYSMQGGRLGRMHQVGDGGLFEGKLRGKPKPVKYRCRGVEPGSEWWVSDPYSFGPVLGPLDDFLIAEGTHLRLFDKLGAHLIHHQGC